MFSSFYSQLFSLSPRWRPVPARLRPYPRAHRSGPRITCQRIDGSEWSSQSTTVRDISPAVGCIGLSALCSRRVLLARPYSQDYRAREKKDLTVFQDDI